MPRSLSSVQRGQDQEPESEERKDTSFSGAGKGLQPCFPQAAATPGMRLDLQVLPDVLRLPAPSHPSDTAARKTTSHRHALWEPIQAKSKATDREDQNHTGRVPGKVTAGIREARGVHCGSAV